LEHEHIVRHGGDIQTKVQELEDLSSLRERDKVKDDAIAHLSARLQELERKQQTVTFTIITDTYMK
jgi:hypothetical protein